MPEIASCTDFWARQLATDIWQVCTSYAVPEKTKNKALNLVKVQVEREREKQRYWRKKSEQRI